MTRAFDKLRGRRGVLLDTMVFIYFFEDAPGYANTCESLLTQMAAGLFGGVATPITLAELVVKPLRQNRADVADRYRHALEGFTHLTLLPIDPQAGHMAGALRAKYNLSLPDMLQVASALRFPKPAIVTNDKDLKRVEELDVFVLNDLRHGE